MKLRCKLCNNIFDEDEIYESSEEYYSRFNYQVKKIGVSRKGYIKVPHLYICPKCKHLVNNATLEIVHEL